MKNRNSIKDLFSHLSIFRKLDKKSKLNIFQISCSNNFRYLNLPTTNQKQLLKQITRAQKFQDILLFKEILEKIDSDLNYNGLNKNNYINKLFEIEKTLLTFHLDKWESSVVLNIWLVRNNFCPLLRFTFDKWRSISKNNFTSEIPELIEFSTMYLYRLALINKKISIVNGVHLVNGSHNSLFLNEAKGLIIKIPISVAAKYFLNNQEIKVTKLLLKTSLKKYIPNIISFRNKTGIITRSYINGKTGHELLAINFFDKNPKAIKELKIIFNLYQTFTIKTKIKLDIHPGNFIWSTEKQKWFFIDSGPIPIIGSEYFPLDSFGKYFKKIWIQRYERMKKFPIRSVDLNIERKHAH